MCVSVLYRWPRIGPTELKFTMEDHIYPGEIIGYISLRYPYPMGRGGHRVVLEVHAAQMVHFCAILIKKIEGHP